MTEKMQDGLSAPEEVIKSKPEKKRARKAKSVPDGWLRVEFLDGAFKGKIKVVSVAQAAALRGRVKKVDG